MQEKYGFIYLWYDRKHKRFYIGSHWGTEDDGYDCSSPWMKNSRKRRPQDFKRRILQYVYDRDIILVEEHKWLDLIKDEELGKRYYNLTKHKPGHWSTNSDARLTVGEKISKKQTGRKLTPEWKANIGAAARGKTISEEQKVSISNSMKSRTYVSNIELNKTKHVLHEDVDKYIENGWYIGRLPGWKAGENNPRLGKPGYWKDKESPNKGRQYDDEFKRKRSEAVKGRIWCNNGVVMKQVRPEDMPEGFVLGRLKRIENNG